MTNSTTETKQHPEDVELIAYLDNPSADEFFELRKHLSYCNRCRTRIIELRHIDNVITTQRTLSPKGRYDTHLDDILLRAYHANGLDSTFSDQVKGHLDQCAECRVASMIVSAKLHAKGEITNHPNMIKRDAMKTRASKQWRLNSALTWRTLAVAASISFIAVLLSTIQTTDQTAPFPRIASYVDDERLIIYSALQGPTNSFAGDADQQQIPLPALAIQPLSDNRIEVSWPPVVNSDSYIFSLYNNASFEAPAIVSISSQLSRVDVDTSGLTANKRYFWALRGQKQDGTLFVSTGGLILTN